VAFDLRSGATLALEGGYQFSQSAFHRAVQAKRQAGSAFKPFVFSAAIENGMTPATPLLDAPIVEEEEGKVPWRPMNSDRNFEGEVRLGEALISSRNIPAVRIYDSLGPTVLLSFFQRLGFESRFLPNRSIALGTTEMTPFDLTKAYAVFPRGGRTLNPVLIRRVLAGDSSLVLENPSDPQMPPRSSADLRKSSRRQRPGFDPIAENVVASLKDYPLATDSRQVLDPRVAFVMTHLLKKVVTSGTGRSASGLGFPAAGKTGTTNEIKDAWFIGFTPTLLTGVWVGNDDSTPLQSTESGARAALPIWLRFMKSVASGSRGEFPVPEGVHFSAEGLPEGESPDAFVQGSAPKPGTLQGQKRGPAPGSGDGEW
jgi:penicillin-binding protein 1A